MTNTYFVHLPAEIFSIASLWVRKGYTSDPPGKEGLVHFFEHLFLTKTRTFANKIEALRAIDGAGLFYNAFTGKDMAYFFLLQQPDRLQRAAAYLLEGMQAFDVDEADIAKERQVILEEQQKHRANPSVYVWALADQGLWPHGNMGRSGLGNEYSVSSITKQDLLGYKDVLFNEDSVGFITLSPHDRDAGLHRALDTTKLPPAPSSAASDDPGSGHGSRKLLVEYRPMDVVFLALSVPLPGTAGALKDKVALDLIRNYLASGWSSKLVERLRLECNYTYWVYSDLQMYDRGGCLKLSLSSRKEHINEIIRIVREEVEQLRQEEMNPEVLKHHVTAAKAHIIKNYLRPENMLWWYGWNIIAANHVISVGDHLRRLDALTGADITDAARRYLDTDNLHVAALGAIQEEDFGAS